MTNRWTVERTYSMFGLGLVVKSNAESVDSAIDTRLRFFRVEHLERADIVITIRRVPSAVEHWVTRPEVASRPVYDTPTGEIIYADECGRLYLDDGDKARAIADCRRSTIDISVASDDPTTIWTSSHPFFTIPLIDLLKHHGCYSLHAASVSLAGRGLLIAGSSGSGKSTLMLALLRGGFDYLGDDMIFLENNNRVMVAHGFPDEIDLTPDSARFFPELSDPHTLQRSSGWAKYQLLPENVYGIEPLRECRPSVVLFPRIRAGMHSSITALTAQAALLELAPNILLTDTKTSQAHFDALGALVAQCDCYRLESGTDLQSTVSFVRNLLSSVAD